MVQPLRLRRAARLWLAQLDRKSRDADLRVRCRVLLKVHTGNSPHTAAREIGCALWTACGIVARFRPEGEFQRVRCPERSTAGAAMAAASSVWRGCRAWW